MGILRFLRKFFKSGQRNDVERREIVAERLMIRRGDISALYTDFTKDEIIDQFLNSKSPVLPVCRDSLDDIIGAYDIFSCFESFKNGNTINLNNLQNVIFVAPTTDLFYLISTMCGKNIPIAIVVDDFGGTKGIVTHNSIIRNLYGSFLRTNAIQNNGDGIIMVDGRAPFSDISRMLNIEEEEDEQSETIGGFLMKYTGNVPKKGEEILINGFLFTILASDNRRVLKVSIQYVGKRNET